MSINRKKSYRVSQPRDSEKRQKAYLIQLNSILVAVSQLGSRVVDSTKIVRNASSNFEGIFQQIKEELQQIEAIFEVLQTTISQETQQKMEVLIGEVREWKKTPDQMQQFVKGLGTKRKMGFAKVQEMKSRSKPATERVRKEDYLDSNNNIVVSSQQSRQISSQQQQIQQAQIASLNDILGQMQTSLKQYFSRFYEHHEKNQYKKQLREACQTTMNIFSSIDKELTKQVTTSKKPDQKSIDEHVDPQRGSATINTQTTTSFKNIKDTPTSTSFLPVTNKLELTVRKQETISKQLLVLTALQKNREVKYTLEHLKQIQVKRKHRERREKAFLLAQVSQSIFGLKRYKKIALVCSPANVSSAFKVCSILHKGIPGVYMIVVQDQITYTEFEDDKERKKYKSLFKVILTCYPTETDRKSYKFYEACKKEDIEKPFIMPERRKDYGRIDQRDRRDFNKKEYCHEERSFTYICEKNGKVKYFRGETKSRGVGRGIGGNRNRCDQVRNSARRN